MSIIAPEVEIAFNVAAAAANERHHEFITLEHLLFALLHDKLTAEIIRECGDCNPDDIKKKLDLFLKKNLTPLPSGVNPTPQPTMAFQRVVQRAALQLQSSERKVKVKCVDLLVSLFDEQESHAVYILDQEGVSRLSVVRYLSHNEMQSLDKNNDTKEQQESRVDQKEKEDKGARKALELYTTNLIEKARKGLIDPIIGREPELKRTVRTLCRRRKNNPLFVGDPGVGKTALAEGLALKIAQGNVPDILKQGVIYSLDMGSLLAGTKYRGDFEQRFKAVLKALMNIKHSILFIDEIHTVIGGGAVSGGAMDASNLLKPVLASGEIKCIGSTTHQEFRSCFEKDRALARRFQKIDIEEPTVEESVKILEGLKPYYEEHHGIRYTKSAIRSAVELSSRYINDRKLPDKAIDVIDEVGASIKIMPANKRRRTVDTRAIENIVAGIARIPPKTVSSDDKDHLLSLENELGKRVFGQEAAISALVSAIKLSRAGLGHPEKPVGCFLFTGPTGVGKTEVSKQLAHIMGIKFLRFDMSEYMEQHTVSRLIGAPPGYVGFDQGGLLTDSINRNPYSVLLLDEIEKAHPNLFDILLQIMDHATLTDSNGKKADFRNVVLIMTSNVGARELAKGNIGFSQGEPSIKGRGDHALKNTFSPEFRNRLDAVIRFDRLSLPDMRKVVSKLIEELSFQLKEKKISLHLTSKAQAWLAKQGYDPVNGARPLARLIHQEIKRPLADEVLFGKLVNGGKVKITLKEGKIFLEYSGLG